MANFHTVPVIDVHKENFKQIWPTMMLALKTATYVAMDLEMSGLGNRRLLLAKSIEDRFNNMVAVAKTRSVVSLGLSCFKIQQRTTSSQSASVTNQDTDIDQNETPGEKSTSESEIKKNLRCFVQTFNIVLLCKDSYMVEPESLRFLVHHGFDFNKQYSMGISYHPGPDKPDDGEQNIRGLLNEIIVNKVPVALHNGLVDLVFLYNAFYSTVPSKLSQFVSDLSEIFSGGVYDTKYIVEYEVRLASSYLEYAFRKSQKDNVHQYDSHAAHVKIKFPEYPDGCEHIEYRECGLPERGRDFTGLQTCEQFGAFGWCKLADNCPKSHDIDAILDADDNTTARKRKKRNDKKKPKQPRTDGACAGEQKGEGSASDEEMDTVEKTQGAATVQGVADDTGKQDTTETSVQDSNSTTNNTNHTDTNNSANHAQDHVNGLEAKSTENTDKIAKSRCTGHRAGFDAFMTGFTLAVAVLKSGKQPSQPETALSLTRLSDYHLDKLQNNVYLSGKDMPLKITKSNFSKSSKEHRIKYAKLMSSQVSDMVT